ncbi:Piso0_002076 [Millerozyma farinosa CBS 7064]|uniref:Piso0_002076 protein n=1 Tax=Pichia sorbitophila (strain ATCC MYA-4447 / BCRC 22081 / CBS 7064 / NBRC 10061 / NRRL Y-12695) TaxID=559304 RepID=G8YBM2_PICSO|nr:Piso0_002076 [Millerozyma farinosa CBS 7064]
MASEQTRKIDLTQLQPQQILEIRKSTEQEISHFTQSLQALQSAQAKLRDCITSIEGVEKSNKTELLVPMTSSLYLPGKLVQKDEYLVDIGTGYYVGKSANDAKVVYQKKIDKLDEDAKKLKDILVQKNEIMNSINIVLRNKVMELEKAKTEE